MPTRRRALALLGGALAATSGCVSGLLDDDPPLEHGEKMRATGEPASRSLNGWPPRYEYVAANDTVHDTYDPDDSSPSAYLDATLWATEEGENAAVNAVIDRFDPSAIDYEGIRVYASGDASDPHVDVRHLTYSERPFGTETVDPDLSTTELVETAPETVTVTVPLQEQTWTIAYPVFVERYDYIEHTPSE